jgi:hypothetical protein
MVGVKGIFFEKISFPGCLYLNLLAKPLEQFIKGFSGLKPHCFLPFINS